MKESWGVLEQRINPTKKDYIKVDVSSGALKKNKAYDYYECDYCGDKIINTNKAEDRTGGILHVPISSSKSLNLAICNKCLRNTLSEINKKYKINL